MLAVTWLQFVAAAATALFTFLTWKVYRKIAAISEAMVVETRLNREAAFAPVLSMRLASSASAAEHETWHCEFQIENVGRGTAYNIHAGSASSRHPIPLINFGNTTSYGVDCVYDAKLLPSGVVPGWSDVARAVTCTIFYSDINGRSYSTVFDRGTVRALPCDIPVTP